MSRKKELSQKLISLPLFKQIKAIPHEKFQRNLLIKVRTIPFITKQKELGSPVAQKQKQTAHGFSASSFITSEPRNSEEDDWQNIKEIAIICE